MKSTEFCPSNELLPTLSFAQSSAAPLPMRRPLTRPGDPPTMGFIRGILPPSPSRRHGREIINHLYFGAYHSIAQYYIYIFLFIYIYNIHSFIYIYIFGLWTWGCNCCRSKFENLTSGAPKCSFVLLIHVGTPVVDFLTNKHWRFQIWLCSRAGQFRHGHIVCKLEQMSSIYVK